MMKAMSPEERFERIDRRLEWMSGVLAELVASSQRHDAQIAHNAQQISQLAGVVRDLAHVTAEQGNRIEAGFKRLEERQQQTDEQMKRTDERLRRTDERLNALIAMDERRRSNEQN